MSAGSFLSRALRAVGTVMMFSIVGPLAIAFAGAVAVTALGKPFLDLFTMLTGIPISRNWLSITLLLLFGFLAVSSLLPSFCAGVVFALFAFVLEWPTCSAALASAAIAVAGFVLLGAIASPPENSPLILTPAGDVRRAASLALFLMVPAAAASSLAWLVSRPLHRVVLTA